MRYYIIGGAAILFSIVKQRRGDSGFILSLRAMFNLLPVAVEMKLDTTFFQRHCSARERGETTKRGRGEAFDHDERHSISILHRRKSRRKTTHVSVSRMVAWWC